MRTTIQIIEQIIAPLSLHQCNLQPPLASMARLMLVFVLLARGCLAVEWSSTVLSLLESQVGIAGSANASATAFDWTATWGHDHSTFAIAVEAHTTGWVGFGISEAAGMRGADIMMGFVDEEGAAHVNDYYSIDNATPLLDGCQDWTVHYGEEKEGWTLIIASRALTTEDSNDRPILLTGMKRFGVLVAHGPNDPSYKGQPSYHGTTKVNTQFHYRTHIMH